MSCGEEGLVEERQTGSDGRDPLFLQPHTPHIEGCSLERGPVELGIQVKCLSKLIARLGYSQGQCG